MSSLYAKAREALLSGDVSWRDDVIKAVLVTDLYAVDLAADEFLSDVPAESIKGSAQTLQEKSIDLGVADAADLTFSAVDSAEPVIAVLVYQDAGADENNRLLLYLDAAARGLPTTPTGDNVTVAWSNGPNKIFRL